MFLDASAVIAILGEELDAPLLQARLDAADTPFAVSPLSLFEAVIGLARKKAVITGHARPSTELLQQAQHAVDSFVRDLDAREIDVTAEIGRKAREAATRFGKVAGHSAKLNFGDCFAYACAKTLRVPLLFKGNDFSLTDVNEAEK